MSASWVSSRLLGGALILGYHRVSDDPFDPYSIGVAPQRFSEHLEVLRRNAHPLSLREVVKRLQNGNLPPRAVAVTLDDGYADNLYDAKPLLERFEVPATVFIATGYLGREFWWDELGRLLLAPANLVRALPLDLGSGYELAMVDGPDVVAEEDPFAARHRLLTRVYRCLRPLPPVHLQRAMASLRGWADDGSSDGERCRALKPEEVAQLAYGGLIEIGAHSVTHPVLASLPLGEQRSEIMRSRECLEGLLGRSVDGFSYPNSSLSRETPAILRETGFAYACAGGEGAVWRGSDPFRLPRCWVPNWDGTTFSYWLRRWL